MSEQARDILIQFNLDDACAAGIATSDGHACLEAVSTRCLCQKGFAGNLPTMKATFDLPPELTKQLKLRALQEGSNTNSTCFARPQDAPRKRGG